MRKISKHKHTVLLLLFWNFSYGQTDFGSWLIYKNSLKLNPQTSIDTQLQRRSFSFNFDEDQSLITTGLTHRLNQNLSLSAGYRQIRAIEEQGAYQKVALRTQLNNVRLTNTFLLEERWIAKNLQIRYRFGFVVNLPLSPKYEFLFSEEIFLQNSATSFNQNRVTAQVSYKLADALQLNTGLMHWQFNTNKRWVFLLSLSHNITL